MLSWVLSFKLESIQWTLLDLASLLQIFWALTTIFDLIITETSLNSIFPVAEAKILRVSLDSSLFFTYHNHSIWESYWLFLPKISTSWPISVANNYFKLPSSFSWIAATISGFPYSSFKVEVKVLTMTLKGLLHMASYHLFKVLSYYPSLPLISFPHSYLTSLLAPHQTHQIHSWHRVLVLAIPSTCNALLPEVICLIPSPPPNLYSNSTFSIRPTLTTTTISLPGTPNSLYYNVFSFL